MRMMPAEAVRLNGGEKALFTKSQAGAWIGLTTDHPVSLVVLVSEDAESHVTSQPIGATVTDGRGLGSLETPDGSCSVWQADVHGRGASRLSPGEDPLLGGGRPPPCCVLTW